uniref:Uncharacterized protein n=2 Tax=Aegilops tauschii subsp. strangulata TaxID=200361 RepID=A0A452ZYE7_AEGTS
MHIAYFMLLWCQHRTQIKTKHLKMVALEQQSAEETALHLVEKHKRKKQSTLDKILKLEQQLNVKSRSLSSKNSCSANWK